MATLTGNKFDPNKDIPNLSDKTYIVTGGSAGIGFGIVAHLLQHKPSKIYLLGNKEDHLAEAHDELKEWGDISSIETKQCNFADLKQTDQVAKEFSESLQTLDGLVCNAGLGVGPYSETPDGLDSHIQINHLAQFHLTLTLLPLLQRTPDSRLVWQSSDLHRGVSSSDVPFASLAELRADLGAMKLYACTKLAQILFIRALVRRAQKGELGFGASGIGKEGPWMNATHPGAVNTDQPEQAVEAYGKLGKVGVKAVRPFMKDAVEEGCRSALFAVASEEVARDGIQGQYIVPDRKVTEPSKLAQDEELGERLWKLTEQVLSEKLVSLPYMTSYVDPMAKEGIHGHVEGGPVRDEH
ncbi:MAG: hypothetical protein M1822_004981 [Bathelium mastoideum]|nr:MAG: hypothetical protein M1822_004981 [Bathelium mastoideum]